MWKKQLDTKIVNNKICSRFKYHSALPDIILLLLRKIVGFINFLIACENFAHLTNVLAMCIEF